MGRSGTSPKALFVKYRSNMLVSGKVALVTGGASGIGLSCIEELLKNDVLGVTLVDINERDGIAAANTLNERYGQRRVIFVKANIANKDEFEGAFKRTIETFKQLDMLFNNAAIFDEINYENCIDVNLKGTVHGLRLAIDDYLPKYKSGMDALIINTASIAGLAPFECMEIYSSTKFAVIGLSRNFGCEYHYERTGVKVLAVCPATTITPILDQALHKILYTDKLQTVIDLTQHRTQTPAEFAKCFIRIAEKGENGSVWHVVEGKETKVEFPELIQL